MNDPITARAMENSPEAAIEEGEVHEEFDYSATM
jgi:hypothetical protein